jgi:hypothetical protein
MTFDYRKIAFEIAKASSVLSNRLYKLDFLHKVDQTVAIAAIKKEEANVRKLIAKIWSMKNAEYAMEYMDDDIYAEVLDWLDSQNIAIIGSQKKEEVVLIAIEAGWELFPEPSDADLTGEPPLTMAEMHENARKEKMESRRK